MVSSIGVDLSPRLGGHSRGSGDGNAQAVSRGVDPVRSLGDEVPEAEASLSRLK